MPDFPRYDWNAVAAGVQMLPDEAIRLALQSAPNLDALFKAWEGVWKQVSAADATLQGKMLCEILLGFYRAEALRREITEPK
ncbi:MAG TPA: hypothetical protein VMH02_05315 [Verrucomicrobiae bacterium]|nr:hypothetical protein [Verrucomicrobiae bacterium]